MTRKEAAATIRRIVAMIHLAEETDDKIDIPFTDTVIEGILALYDNKNKKCDGVKKLFAPLLGTE